MTSKAGRNGRKVYDELLCIDTGKTDSRALLGGSSKAAIACWHAVGTIEHMLSATEHIAAALVAAGIAPFILSAGQSPNGFALQQFSDQIDAYMAVRQHVAQNVPPPTTSGNASDIVAMQAIWANAIRKARPHAKAGDIFTYTVGVEFRRRIQDVLAQHGVSEGGLGADLQREFPETPPALTVNGTFDWRFGAMMPTAVIQVLPEVPWPLQYRFVGRDLVLLDLDAGLVVDVLPAALTAP